MHRLTCSGLLAVILTSTTAGRLSAQPDDDPLPPGALMRFGDTRGRHDAAIYNSTLAPDGKRLATVSERSVAVWDAASGRRLARFPLPFTSHFWTPVLAWSPDSHYLGLARSFRLAILWDMHTGVEQARLEGNGDRSIGCARFTPDGKEFFWGGAKRLTFWDVRLGNTTRFGNAGGRVLLLSPDARTAVTLDAGQVVSLRDAAGKELFRTATTIPPYLLNAGAVLAAFAPDGKTLALVHDGKEIQLREVAGGKLRRTLPIPEEARKGPSIGDHRVGFTEDGRTLFLASDRDFILRWDAATGKELPALRGHTGRPVNLHRLADGKTLLSTARDGLLRRWDAQTGKQLAEPPGYHGVLAAALSPDGRRVAIGDERGRLDLWSADGRLLRTLRRAGPFAGRLSFSPDGKTLAGVHHRRVQVWDVATSKERLLDAGDPMPAASSELHWRNFTTGHGSGFSPDGRSLLVNHMHGIHALHPDTGKVRWQRSFPQSPPFLVQGAFGADGLAVARLGPSVEVLDPLTGKTVHKLRFGLNYPDRLISVAALAWSPDRRLLAAEIQNMVALFDADTGRRWEWFRAARGYDPENGAGQVFFVNGVQLLEFSPGGQWLAVATSDGDVKLWDPSAGKELLRLSGHAVSATSLAFSPDGRTLLTGGADGQAFLWSLRPPTVPRGDLAVLWADLAGSDAGKAFRAVWR